MNHKTAVSCMVLAFAALFAPAARAAVVFDNLGSGYEPFGNWVGTDFFPDAGQDITAIVATDFVPTKSGKLSDIWAGLVLQTGQNDFTLALLQDNAGEPGSVLWSQDFHNRLSVSLGSVVHVGGGIPLVDAPQLVAGTRYWLEAEAPVVTGLVIDWYTNAAGDTGTTALHFSNLGDWQIYNNDTRPAFTVAVLPAPAALPAGLALLSLTAFKRRRRRA